MYGGCDRSASCPVTLSPSLKRDVLGAACKTNGKFSTGNQHQTRERQYHNMDHTLNLQHQDWISTDKGRDIPLCIPESLPPNSSAGAVYHRIDLPLSTDTQALQLQISYAPTVNQYHAKGWAKPSIPHLLYQYTETTVNI